MQAKAELDQETAFFIVFCIESIADELETTGNNIYKLLTDDSDIIDSYIIPHYETLHTQGKAYIVNELIELMKTRSVLS